MSRDKDLNIVRKNAVGMAMGRSGKKNSVIQKEADELFALHGLDYQLPKNLLGQLTKNSRKTLDVHQGLALANVLDTMMADFFDEEVLKLGCFDVKLLYDDAGLEDLLYRLEYEFNRIGVFTKFPSAIYRHKEPADCTSKQAISRRKRLEAFQNQHSQTVDYYPIDSLLTFTFSPIFDLDQQQKLNALETMLGLFKGQKGLLRHCLHFFGPSYPRSSASMEIFPKSHIVLFCLPISNYYVEIKNPSICKQITGFFRDHEDFSYDITSTEESCEILERLAALISQHELPSIHELRRFYEASPAKIQHMMYENLHRTVLSGYPKPAQAGGQDE